MKKKGLSNIIQVVLVIILAILLVGILAFMIHKGLTRSGGAVETEMLVLQSEFSIVSASNFDGTIDVIVKRESGTGTFPTVVLTSSDDKTASNSYRIGEIGIYQTVSIKFSVNDLLRDGFNDVAKIEVYASAIDRKGEIVNSRLPKDVKIMRDYLIQPSPDCGNGAINEGEWCDDNNTVSGDGCSVGCVVEHGWYCSGEPSSCTTHCGEGKIAGSETCDDNNTVSGDGCSGSCQRESGWECGDEPSECYSLCGDNITIIGKELCDDGINNGCSGYPGCNSTCSGLLQCGNNITECNEECDDGQNGNNGDACYQNCTFTFCGDSIIQRPNGEHTGGIGNGGNEECDRTSFGGQSCQSLHYGPGGSLLCASNCVFDTSGCTPPAQCGNGLINTPNETCDDNNTVSGDGCSGSCQRESGWTCIGQPSACSPDCGDGLIRDGEGCDDNNTVSGDGCNATCHIEQYWNCTGEPSNCGAICGDSHVIIGEEECDDGSAGSNPHGPCYNCRRAFCGDNVVQSPNWYNVNEQCDDGAANNNQSDHCRTNCSLPWCGDGVCDPNNGEHSIQLSPPMFSSSIPHGDGYSNEGQTDTEGESANGETNQQQDNQIADEGGGCSDCGSSGGGWIGLEIRNNWRVIFNPSDGYSNSNSGGSIT